MARKHPQLRVDVFAEFFVELFVEVVVVVSGGGGGVVNVLLCGGGVAPPGGGRGVGGGGGSRLGRGVLIVEALAAALPSQTTFSPAEWASFGVRDPMTHRPLEATSARTDHFVSTSVGYFTPAAGGVQLPSPRSMRGHTRRRWSAAAWAPLAALPTIRTRAADGRVHGRGCSPLRLARLALEQRE